MREDVINENPISILRSDIAREYSVTNVDLNALPRGRCINIHV